VTAEPDITDVRSASAAMSALWRAIEAFDDVGKHDGEPLVRCRRRRPNRGKDKVFRPSREDRVEPLVDLRVP
jgi:hypothetical protein